MRHRVLDIEETLSATLLRQARSIARDFSIGQVAAAEDEINNRLGGVAIDVTAPASIEQAMHEATDRGCLGAEYGLWTRAITHLTLDQAATDHNTKMMKLTWAIEEEKAEQELRKIKNKNQQEITTARIDALPRHHRRRRRRTVCAAAGQPPRRNLGYHGHHPRRPARKPPRHH